MELRLFGQERLIILCNHLSSMRFDFVVLQCLCNFSMINSRVLLHVIFFFLHDELTIKKQRNLMTDIRLPPCYRITSVHFRSGQWRLTNM